MSGLLRYVLDNPEKGLTLAQVAEGLPGNVHRKTVWRWVTQGVRGVKLETACFANRHITTEQKVREFNQKLNAMRIKTGRITDSADDVSEARRRRAKAAGKRLDAAKPTRKRRPKAKR